MLFMSTKRSWAVLNFRKLRQDFSQAIIKDAAALYAQAGVLEAKIESMKGDLLRIRGKVSGKHDNSYDCEIEIDRKESAFVGSNCDCPYKYECQHIAALLLHLEKQWDSLVVHYSKEAPLPAEAAEEDSAALREVFKEAETKETARNDIFRQKELIEEYVVASDLLAQSPFFTPEERLQPDEAELAVLLTQEVKKKNEEVEYQLALRLPYRSKPLQVSYLKEFFEGVCHKEPQNLGGRNQLFTFESFNEVEARLLRTLVDHTTFQQQNQKSESNQRLGSLGREAFGSLLAHVYEWAATKVPARVGGGGEEEEPLRMPSLFCENLEQPLIYSPHAIQLSFQLEIIRSPVPKLMVTPYLVTESGNRVLPEECTLFECIKPGVIINSTYYRFAPNIKRKHLRYLLDLRNTIVPQPLFGTFVENALPQLQRFGQVLNREVIEEFVTLPYVGKIEAICDINYLDGELEASLDFIYDQTKVPAAAKRLTPKHVMPFMTEQGILARNLCEERQLTGQLFQGFAYDMGQGVYVAKTGKKIVEFMTDVVPRYKEQVTFNCPENLLNQFLYDKTEFELSLSESDQVDSYEVTLKVNGELSGVTVDQLWECISSRRSFIELQKNEAKVKGRTKKATNTHKILVLDLERIGSIVQIFDELGLTKLEDYTEKRPLWSLAAVNAKQFEGLPIKLTLSKKLQQIQRQLLGQEQIETSPMPKAISATLREYQKEGVHWLERLRSMHLNGILADDMGLGKTLQAIVGITQNHEEDPQAISLVVCPTSLLYNWKEEFHKFHPGLKVAVVDGSPGQRKKILSGIKKYQVVITSYTLLQKDIEEYSKENFSYIILDEAQHIKNRHTRNAKSAKMLKGKHRLILTGTPVENSLDELWSLFDFLMPGLLSRYERFADKYVRAMKEGDRQALEQLKDKIAPFVLRRVKSDVLSELPPVSEIVYHCHLTDVQRELYSSYASSAREELSRLVNKEGFDKVQIHVLATLTRLKQICCHPALFAKEQVEGGDSAKYEMLMELIQSLTTGNHKTVVFSQYTRMLKIMQADLEALGIRFAYLDGSSKNRLEIVNQFNEDPGLTVFLVSLKAGGVGLNLTGADTVIHYDMWWNPAVENQATDRVHRMGQKSSVSSYKLVTLGTIEEKILQLQNRKRGLVKQIVSCDEEVMSKLTWEEVLELLQT